MALLRRPGVSLVVFVALAASLHGMSEGQSPAPRDWGAPPVEVTHENGAWTIAGRHNTVVLSEADLALTVRASGTEWRMVPSGAHDLQARSGGRDRWYRLADAAEKDIARYDTGYASGVKLTLAGFRSAGEAPTPAADLLLVLTVAVEGGDEDVLFDIAAVEGSTTIRELNWPTSIDGRTVDATVLSNDNGELLPRRRNSPARAFIRRTGRTARSR